MVAPVPPLTTATIPVTLVAVPIKLAVMVPAEKSPLASLLTIALDVLLLVAPFAEIVAVLIAEAVLPPTVTTEGVVAVPPISPANLILPVAKLVASGAPVLTAVETLLSI